MLKRSYVSVLFFLLTNHAVHGMDCPVIETQPVANKSLLAWAFSLFSITEPQKEVGNTPSYASLPKVPSNLDTMAYMSPREQAKLDELASAHKPPKRIAITEEMERARIACAQLYYEYPGGPVRPTTPTQVSSVDKSVNAAPENQRCLLKVSFGNVGGCCP